MEFTPKGGQHREVAGAHVGERAIAEPRGGGGRSLLLVRHVLGSFFDVRGIAIVEGSIGVVLNGGSHDEWDEWAVGEFKDKGE